MKNVGKIFEQDFQKSVPDYALLYRLPDSAQSFCENKNLRFSRKNPFDYLLWDSERHILYALEMKTVKGKSISFERNKDENREIHYHQIQGLNDWNRFDGITCGFIIEFRQIETTVFIDIDSFNSLILAIDKKSFNIQDLNDFNIKYQIIGQKKQRTRYLYDIDTFLDRKTYKKEN